MFYIVPICKFLDGLYFCGISKFCVYVTEKFGANINSANNLYLLKESNM